MIGKVGSPVGIRGEFRITLYSQDSGNLKEGKTLLLERAANLTEAKIKRVRYQKDKPVVKLEGFDDRNAAEAARGMEVLYLKRLTMGPLILDDTLEPGEYRRLTNEELQALKSL